MYLLYLDDSGTVADSSQRYFILAGIAVFERQGHWISKELEPIAAAFNPAEPWTVELHGSPMIGGKNSWRRIRKEVREKAVSDALIALATSHESNRVFGVAVNKSKLGSKDAVEFAFEQLCNRFDLFLMRLHRKNQTQRGLIIFDKSTHETAIQRLATEFCNIGHRWGVVRNLAEVPVFLDSRASRLLQLADLVAYAMFRHFELNDPRFFDIFKHRFDREGNTVHGLVHFS